uniref:Putative secreted protein n=1 Tax=Psorophora albipes TaxID=869069 RepID=T1DJ77_9DIPT
MKLQLVAFVTILVVVAAVVAFPNHRRNGTSDLPNPSGQWNGTDSNWNNTDAEGPFDPSSWRNSSEPIQPRPFRWDGDTVTITVKDGKVTVKVESD